MKEKREGWEWIECGASGGFWRKISGKEHKHKLSFFCPHEKCGRPTGTLDDPYLEKYGVCRLCFTLYIDERKEPLIDLSKYKKI